jgi:putative Mn2+ efflux pump MntP
LAVIGVAISIDNLVVGFALSFSHVPFLLAAGVIAAVSVALSLVGLELGKHLGKRFEEWSEELSGCIIMLVGLTIVFGFF